MSYDCHRVVNLLNSKMVAATTGSTHCVPRPPVVCPPSTRDPSKDTGNPACRSTADILVCLHKVPYFKTLCHRANCNVPDIWQQAGYRIICRKLCVYCRGRHRPSHSCKRSHSVKCTDLNRSKCFMLSMPWHKTHEGFHGDSSYVADRPSKKS